MFLGIGIRPYVTALGLLPASVLIIVAIVGLGLESHVDVELAAMHRNCVNIRATLASAHCGGLCLALLQTHRPSMARGAARLLTGNSYYRTNSR